MLDLLFVLASRFSAKVQLHSSLTPPRNFYLFQLKLPYLSSLPIFAQLFRLFFSVNLFRFAVLCLIVCRFCAREFRVLKQCQSGHFRSSCLKRSQSHLVCLWSRPQVSIIFQLLSCSLPILLGPFCRATTDCQEYNILCHLCASRRSRYLLAILGWLIRSQFVWFPSWTQFFHFG